MGAGEAIGDKPVTPLVSNLGGTRSGTGVEGDPARSARLELDALGRRLTVRVRTRSRKEIGRAHV